MERKGLAKMNASVFYTLEIKIISIQQIWLLEKVLMFFLCFCFFSLAFENLKSKHFTSKLFWKIYQIFSEILFGKKNYGDMSNLSNDL